MRVCGVILAELSGVEDIFDSTPLLLPRDKDQFIAVSSCRIVRTIACDGNLAKPGNLKLSSNSDLRYIFPRSAYSSDAINLPADHFSSRTWRVKLCANGSTCTVRKRLTYSLPSAATRRSPSYGHGSGSALQFSLSH